MTGTPWRAGWCCVATILLTLCGGAARADGSAVIPKACTPAAVLRSYVGLLTASPTLTEPATRFLPDDGTAKLYFHHALAASGSGAADDFYVFESPWANPAWFNNSELQPVIGVLPPPAAAGPDFLSTDSVQLQVQAAPAASTPWHKRSFIVVDCEGAIPVAWGSVPVAVTDSGLAAEICVALAVLVYFGCMLCLRDKRKPGGTKVFRPFSEASDSHVKTQQYFATTYPSVFRRQEIGFWQLINPVHLTVNDVGVPSVQKFQVILFSSLVVGLLLYLVLRVGNLVSLSGSVVELIGISGVSAAGAAGVTQKNKRLSFENWSWLQQEEILQTAGEARPALWSDMVTSNHEFDIYKMQTLVFSVVVAVALFIAGAGGDLDTFAVPDALLGVLGLSQVTYIGGLLAQPPSVADLDAAITKLRAARETFDAAINRKTDIDNDGQLLAAPVSAPAVAGAMAKTRYNKQLKTIVPMIESALEVRVNANCAALQPIP